MASISIKDDCIWVESDLSFDEIYCSLGELYSMEQCSAKGLIWIISDKITEITLEQLDDLEIVIGEVNTLKSSILKAAIITPLYFYDALLDYLFCRIPEPSFQIRRFKDLVLAQKWICSE